MVTEPPDGEVVLKHLISGQEYKIYVQSLAAGRSSDDSNEVIGKTLSSLYYLVWIAIVIAVLGIVVIFGLLVCWRYFTVFIIFIIYQFHCFLCVLRRQIHTHTHTHTLQKILTSIQFYV